jgi:hypothetical protein
MSRETEWADALCTDMDDDFADERAQDKRRRDFDRMAEREYRETGTVLVWGDDAPEDDA